jgi:hypothetical protein
MKRLVFAFALLALLVVSAPAMAKELTNVSVCGPDGCNDLSGAGNLRDFPTGGEPTGQTPAPAAFYEVRYPIDAEGHNEAWTTWYVPSAKLLASIDEREGVTWMPLDAPELAALTKGLKPFAKPEVSSVTIGSREVTDDPASYIRLFTVESDGYAVPQGLADWEPIVFHSKSKSPWTAAETGLFYSPSNGMLQRGIEIVKLPSGMSADIRAGDSLGGGGSNFSWRTVFFALVAAVALLIAASLIRPLRRRVLIRRAPTTA